MKYYKGIVCYLLKAPLAVEGEGAVEMIAGYYRNVAVAAHNEARMKELLISLAELDEIGSVIDWTRCELEECSFVELTAACQSRYKEREELLYSSGRIFFPPGDSA